MRLSVLAVMLLSAGVSASSARADDISDSIAEAKAAYDRGKISEAKHALEIANQLVAQKQAEALAKLMPEAPAGWIAEKVDSNAAVTAIFGGGITAERKFTKDGKTVNVNLMANSPLLGVMAPMFANVQMLGGMGKVFRQKSRVAVLTSESEVQMILGKTFLTIGGTASEADKRAILDLLDLAAIEAFTQ